MAGAADPDIAVILQGDGAGESTSGLAQMLHQFMEQTLAESPQKRRLAQTLSGEAVFRAAEDREICVAIVFRGDRIELHDGAIARAASASSVTADFLSIAHLTSGQESPWALLARRKLQARVRVRDLAFLAGMLRFMRTPSAASGARFYWLAAAVAGAGLALYLYSNT
jgi:hypothetical protein